jgi:hypothetical protein
MLGAAVELAKFALKYAHTSGMLCSIGSRWQEPST